MIKSRPNNLLSFISNFNLSRVLVFGLCWTLSSFHHSAFPQDLSVDSILLKSTLVKVDNILSSKKYTLQKATDFKDISKNFCLLNYQFSTEAERFLEFSLRESSIPIEVKTSFFLRQYRCFENHQIEAIRNYLLSNLKPNDYLFHELTSIYQLFKFRPLLVSNASSEKLKNDIILELRNTGLRKQTIIELKNKATLANLSINDLEDEIIDLVNSIYVEIHDSNSTMPLVGFYLDVLPNTIGLLNSKIAIVKSLAFLDENLDSPIKGYDDLGNLDFPTEYYLTCIRPKLNTGKLDDLFFNNFAENKDKIKQIIIEDDTIWLEYIRKN